MEELSNPISKKRKGSAKQADGNVVMANANGDGKPKNKYSNLEGAELLSANEIELCRGLKVLSKRWKRVSRMSPRLACAHGPLLNSSLIFNDRSPSTST